MEIKKENAFKKFFKRFGALGLAFVFAIAIALTIALSVTNEPNEPVSTTTLNFGLPMTDAVVIKDFADDKLQHNESLKRWEIHLAVDLASENNAVYTIYDGVVASVKANDLEGGVVTINHANGFVSVYSSLDKSMKVKEGDKVLKGQQLGEASTAASNEAKQGGHLHFTLMKDGQKVDPNNYLDLQNK